MNWKLARLTWSIAGVLALGIGATATVRYMRRAHTTHPKTGKPLIVPGRDGEATLLFNGWRIQPAGRHLQTGDMLLGGAISPDGTTLAICNAGYNAHALHLIDIATEKETASFPLRHAWNGIAWSNDGKKLFVAGGISRNDGDVWTFAKNASGDWEQGKPFSFPGEAKQNCAAGLALSPDNSTLYALNTQDGKLYAFDASTGTVRGSLAVGDHPLTCRLNANGSRLYVADWGGSRVVSVNVTNPMLPTIAIALPTGAHPNDIALSKDGRLFVSCGNADAVTVYDTKTNKWQENIRTTPTPQSLPGSTPNALALSPDGRYLYVANADNNAVCVVDVQKPRSGKPLGFIPSGWYPTTVMVSADGNKILVGSGKGTGTTPNPGPNQNGLQAPRGFPYIAKQLGGLLSFVDRPTNAQLADYTRTVMVNTPGLVTKTAQLRLKTALPETVGQPSPIKYILYIIKENRTYDQVFGDMPQGNGDPTLTLFGRSVTPNHHALAEQYVLLDNLYCNGEVSADGHPWSTSAYATDFTQRNWVLSYSGKGGLPEDDSVSVPRGGYLWDACNRKGLTYRSYGEYVHATSSQAAPEQKVAGAKGLIGHGSARYVGIGRPAGLGMMRDTEKADVFIDEFRAYEKAGNVPRFMVMSLGEDHTRGTVPGAFTPRAAVASNDQAVGKIVEAISHSSLWSKFVIFIIEDDAQNGPDHVDAHRTAGLVVSPYTRRGTVDSTMYSTTSYLRTMELILGLKPLTQYDANATPMRACFTAAPDLTPYTLLAPQIDLAAKNPAIGIGAVESSRMDWSDYDRVDDNALNRILWASIKGPNVPMPAPATPFGNTIRIELRYRVKA